MTFKCIKNKEDGIWNIWDGDEAIPICEHCIVIACHCRDPMITGCDAYKRPKRFVGGCEN